MLSPFEVVLVPYDSEWPGLAASYSQRLRTLGSILVAVHHIGSTSIPGLAAKPIIDLMPLVSSVADLDRLRPSVEALGYDWHGELGISGRRYCTLSDEAGGRVAQLHFFEADSPHAVRHLAFRDYLRAHPNVAREYESEKRRAWKRHPDDSHAYSDEKAAWIKDTEAEALRWLSTFRDAHRLRQI